MLNIRQGREETRQKCVWCVREERKGGAGGGKDDTDDDLDAFAPGQQLVDVAPLPILPPLTKQQESMTVKRTLLINSGKGRREQQPVEAQGRANEWPQRNRASPVSTKAAAAGVGVCWQRCSHIMCSGRLLRVADVHTYNCRRVVTHLRDLDREGRGHPRGQTSNQDKEHRRVLKKHGRCG